MVGDLFEYPGGPPDQGGGSGLQQRRLVHMASGDGEHQAEAGHGGDDEREQLEGQTELQGRDGGGNARADRDQTQRECERDQLGDTEHSRHDQPDDPCNHGRSASVAILLLRIGATSPLARAIRSCPKPRVALLAQIRHLRTASPTARN